MDYNPKYHFSLSDRDTFEKFILKKQCFDKLVLLYKHNNLLYYMGEMKEDFDKEINNFNLKCLIAKNWDVEDINNRYYYFSNFFLETRISHNIFDAIDLAKQQTTGEIYIYDNLYLDNIYLKKNYNARSAMILSDFLNMDNFGRSYSDKDKYYNEVKYIKIVNSKYFHPQILIDNLSNGFIFAILL